MRLRAVPSGLVFGAVESEVAGREWEFEQIAVEPGRAGGIADEEVLSGTWVTPRAGSTGPACRVGGFWRTTMSLIRAAHTVTRNAWSLLHLQP
ncbi:hypothetical protein BH23ACT10_BH23ACT10_03190 [soil metagenome]